MPIIESICTWNVKNPWHCHGRLINCYRRLTVSICIAIINLDIWPARTLWSGNNHRNVADRSLDPLASMVEKYFVPAWHTRAFQSNLIYLSFASGQEFLAIPIICSSFCKCI